MTSRLLPARVNMENLCDLYGVDSHAALTWSRGYGSLVFKSCRSIPRGELKWNATTWLVRQHLWNIPGVCWLDSLRRGQHHKLTITANVLKQISFTQRWMIEGIYVIINNCQIDEAYVQIYWTLYRILLSVKFIVTRKILCKNHNLIKITICSYLIISNKLIQIV